MLLKPPQRTPCRKKIDSQFAAPKKERVLDDAVSIIYILSHNSQEACCGLSVELPCQGSSNERPQHLFLKVEVSDIFQELLSPHKLKLSVSSTWMTSLFGALLPFMQAVNWTVIISLHNRRIIIVLKNTGRWEVNIWMEQKSIWYVGSFISTYSEIVFIINYLNSVAGPVMMRIVIQSPS